jgi:hypothetical protein
MSSLEIIIAEAILVGFPCVTILIAVWMIVRSKK